MKNEEGKKTKTWEVINKKPQKYKPVKLSRKQAKALEQKNLQYKGSAKVNNVV